MELGKHSQLHQLKKLDEVIELIEHKERVIERVLSEYLELVAKRVTKSKILLEYEAKYNKHLSDLQRELAKIKSINNEHDLIAYYNNKINTWDNAMRSASAQVETNRTNDKTLKGFVLNVLLWRRGFRIVSVIVYILLLAAVNAILVK